MRSGLPAGEAASCTTELIESILRRAPQLAVRGVEWRLHEGTLVLSGRVLSFHQKQLAQTAAGRLPGVDRIVNLLEVEHGVARRMPIQNDND